VDHKLSINKIMQEGRSDGSTLSELLAFNQLTDQLDDKEIIQKTIAFAVQLTQSRMGFVNLLTMNQESQRLVFWTENGVGISPGESGDKNIKIFEEIWEGCIQTGKPIFQNTLKTASVEDLDPQNSDLIRHATIPVADQGTLRMILSVGNKATDYGSADILKLSIVGDQLIRILANRRLEKVLTNTKDQYDRLVKNIPIGIFRVHTLEDDELVFEYVNQRFCEMLQVSAEDVYADVGSVIARINSEDIATLREFTQEIRETSGPLFWEGRTILDGETKWFQIEARLEDLKKDEFIWHGALTDISQQKQVERAFRDANTLLENRVAEIEQLQEKLREQAIRDYLTGLFNRRYLDETIEREVARSRREESQISVVMIDIDHFKSINDTYGHPAGDMVLIELGELLLRYSRQSDIACRHGGDEFIVVMPNASPKDAQKRADEWRVQFEEKRFTSNDRRFATTLSMGIASYPLHASSPKGLFQAADQALYQSKIHNNKVSIARRVATTELRSLD